MGYAMCRARDGHRNTMPRFGRKCRHWPANSRKGPALHRLYEGQHELIGVQHRSFRVMGSLVRGRSGLRRTREQTSEVAARRIGELGPQGAADLHPQSVLPAMELGREGWISRSKRPPPPCRSREPPHRVRCRNRQDRVQVPSPRIPRVAYLAVPRSPRRERRPGIALRAVLGHRMGRRRPRYTHLQRSHTECDVRGPHSDIGTNWTAPPKMRHEVKVDLH